MKKHGLRVFLAGCLTALLVTAAGAVRADTDIAYPVTGGNIYFDPATGTVTGCDYEVTEAVIPAEIGGTAVTAVDVYAFSDRTQLTAVTIPDSVTTIDTNAFGRSPLFTTITVDDGNAVYCDIDGVLYSKDHTILVRYPDGRTDDSYIVPDSVTAIADYALGWCTALTDISLPSGINTIGEGAFYYCLSLSDLAIPEGVTALDDHTFYFCTSLSAITIPESVISIGRYTFDSCTSLTEITIPDSVVSIGEGAFDGCTALNSVTLPNNLSLIAAYTFCDCSSLTSITIPGAVTSVEKRAFFNCAALTELLLPDCLSFIGSAAFRGCTTLTEVHLPASLSSIGENAFSYCEALTRLNFPDGLSSIGCWAFYHCTALTSVQFPRSLTTIENGAFHFCPALTQIYYDGLQSQWEQIKVSASNAPISAASVHCSLAAPDPFSNELLAGVGSTLVPDDTGLVTAYFSPTEDGLYHIVTEGSYSTFRLSCRGETLPWTSTSWPDERTPSGWLVVAHLYEGETYSLEYTLPEGGSGLSVAVCPLYPATWSIPGTIRCPLIGMDWFYYSSDSLSEAELSVVRGTTEHEYLRFQVEEPGWYSFHTFFWGGIYTETGVPVCSGGTGVYRPNDSDELTQSYLSTYLDAGSYYFISDFYRTADNSVTCQKAAPKVLEIGNALTLFQECSEWEPVIFSPSVSGRYRLSASYPPYVDGWYADGLLVFEADGQLLDKTQVSDNEFRDVFDLSTELSLYAGQTYYILPYGNGSCSLSAEFLAAAPVLSARLAEDHGVTFTVLPPVDTPSATVLLAQYNGGQMTGIVTKTLTAEDFSSGRWDGTLYVDGDGTTYRVFLLDTHSVSPLCTSLSM